MHDSGIGLRERQRRETLHQLHEAALALALEGGLHAATVDAIAERAGVSRRTFFNYHPSKEDAILGVSAPVVPQEALDAFLAAGDALDPLTRTVRLIAASVIRFTAMREPDAVAQPDSPSLAEAIAIFREAVKDSA